MSNRDSLGFGDLIPQDVAEVFAQERMSKGGRRKKRSKSLGRAIDWFKGKKRKDADANGQSPGLGPGLDLALDGPPAGPQTGQKSGKPGHSPGSSRAVARQGEEDKTPAPPLIQENVFIESSRPKYMEDLHNEAQEGLKLLQQEETSNGVEFRDDLSSISTATTQQEDDGQGFLSDSTMADTSSIVSSQSTVSSMSSRSGITRQGSSFRPLNSGKKPEKAKHRKRSRRTVMGIPQHVQRELGLDRMDWKSNPVLDEELDENMNSEAACDAVDMPSQLTEPSVSLHNAQVNRALAKSQTLQTSNAHASDRDDLALLHRLSNESSHRPRSLAVPWLTTANNGPHGPPSPVMSMNPHAAYMSKIIPNAVMPPSVEVLEIQRGRSRNSQKTVSKSSLLVSSPTGSRASSRASSCRGPSSRAFSSRASSRSSASQQRANYTSDSSGWSRSESSETLVSDSSTISSSTTPQQQSSVDERRVARHGSPLADKVSIHSSAGRVSKATSNGKTEGIARSLSIMKSKRAPPPPSRSYSLHNRMKRKSRDLTELMGTSKETSPQNSVCSGKNSVKSKSGEKKEIALPPVSPGVADSPGYTADTSSLDDSNGSASVSPLKSQLQAPGKVGTVKGGESPAEVTTAELQPQEENVLKKTASPSSGYSSQAGTPTHLSKHPHGTSPKPKKGFLSKLQGLFPGSSPPKNPTKPSDPEPDVKVETGSASPSVSVLRELFNIPPPPKVHAPPPPPPEVWAHNKRTFELLLGPPAPDDSYAAVKRNPKDRRQQRPSPSISVKSASTEGEKKSGLISAELINGVLSSMVLKKVQESEQSQKENKERLTHVENVEKVKGKSNVTEKAESSSGSVLVNGRTAEVTGKVHERLAATQGDRKTAGHTPTLMTPVNTSVETQSAGTSMFISPSPSLQFHHSTTRPAVSPTLESLWPPPPPPIDPAAETLLIRQDGTDFPLPPPPLLSEEGLVVLDNVPQVEGGLDTSVPHVATVQGSLNATSVHTPVVSSKKTPENLQLKTNNLVSTAPKPSPQKIKLILPTPQGYPPPPQSIPPPPPFSAPTLPVNLPANPLLTEGYLPTLVEADSTSTEQLGCPPQEPPPAALLPSAVRLTPPKSIPPPPQPQATVSAPESVPQPPPSQQKILPDPGEIALCTDKRHHAAPVLPAPTLVLNPITTPLEAPPVAPEPEPEVTHSLPSPPINTTPIVTLVTKPHESPPMAKEPPPQPKVTPALPSPAPIVTLVPKSQETPPKGGFLAPSVPSPPINPTPVLTLVSKPLEAPPQATEHAPEPEVLPSLPSPTPIVTLDSKPQEAPPKATEPVPEPEVLPSLPSSSPSQPTTDGSQQPCKETKENKSKEQKAAISEVSTSVVTTVHQPSVNVPSVNKSPEPNRALDLVQPEVVTEAQQPLSQSALESQTVVLKPAPSQPKIISKSIPELVQTEVVIDAQPLTSPPPLQTPTDSSPQQAKETPEEQNKEQEATVDVSNSPEPSKAQEQVLQDVVAETQLPMSQVVLEPEAVVSQQAPPQPLNASKAQDLLQPGVVIEAQQPISQDVPEAVVFEQAPTQPVNIPSPPAPAPQVPSSAKQPGTTEGKTMDSTSSLAQEEGAPSSVPLSLVEPVKHEFMDSSPEATKDHSTQDQPAVTMRTRKPENHIQTQSSSGEAPQKPIRRSLIMSSLPTISPPIANDSQETVPKSQSAEITHTATAVPPSPTKKSPPATTSAPSMNMQEAIRLRTAARAKSPTSPRGPKSPYGGDIHKSPSSVASFIFAKNTRKVGTTPLPEAQLRVQKNIAAEPAAISKPVKEDDLEEKKQGVKVPPPVARKPKGQAKDTVTNVGTE